MSESNLHRDVVRSTLRCGGSPTDSARARTTTTRRGDRLHLARREDWRPAAFRPILLAGAPASANELRAQHHVERAVAKKTCAIFSLEMSELQVVQRLVSMTSEIDGNRMRRGRLSDVEFRSISAASDELQKAPIYVEESSQLTVTDILAKSRRLQAEKGLDLVVVDYLQLIEGAGDDEGRVQEVARISRALKAIARELPVPAALSQLSRQSETRGTEPMLSDLRESGALEADADLVCSSAEGRRTRREHRRLSSRAPERPDRISTCTSVRAHAFPRSR